MQVQAKRYDKLRVEKPYTKEGLDEICNTISQLWGVWRVHLGSRKPFENMEDSLKRFRIEAYLEGLVDYNRKNNTAPPCWEIVKVGSENCSIDELTNIAYSAVKIAEKPE